LLDIYFDSVGGNALFLLSLPPDRRGLIHEHDVERLRELGDVLRDTFATNLAMGATVTVNHNYLASGGSEAGCIVDGEMETYWTTVDGQEEAVIELRLPGRRMFNVAMLQESIAVGQRIERFRLTTMIDGEWRTIAQSTVVGYKRLLRFPTVTTDRVRIEILESRVAPTLTNVGLFYQSYSSSPSGR
jgi:alpha-L-fucosidase